MTIYEHLHNNAIWYVGPVVVALFILKCFMKLTCGLCKSEARLDNKVVIITGGNSGIGFETAKELAKRGAKIILACRDRKKAQKAAEVIACSTGNNNVIVKCLDLTSLESVRNFAKDVLETEQVIHILLNNAGTGKLDNSLTGDNLPIEMQGNHFGPFLLTNLLLPRIKSSAPSRIINVSSIMHYFGKIDTQKIGKPATNAIEHSRVYANSKLANILFTRELHKRLAGTEVTANCLHPGAVNTEIFRNQPSIMKFFYSILFKTPFEGAQTSIYLAVAPELQGVSGKYFSECKQASTSKAAQDDILAKELWEISEKLVGCPSEK